MMEKCSCLIKNSPIGGNGCVRQVSRRHRRRRRRRRVLHRRRRFRHRRRRVAPEKVRRHRRGTGSWNGRGREGSRTHDRPGQTHSVTVG